MGVPVRKSMGISIPRVRPAEEPRGWSALAGGFSGLKMLGNPSVSGRGIIGSQSLRFQSFPDPMTPGA